jgi:hypothetical protein
MKIYSVPKELPPPEPDYANYDTKVQLAREEKHQADLKAWLISHGYTGPHTGEVVYFGVADGHASYMVADGKRFALVHLPYGDAYNYRGIEYFPKKAILQQLSKHKKMKDIFKPL